ncbi:Tropinesterase [Marinomonas spartinae]|uniref:Tropinesterase n=1 Tax=Marinomonas spartinae TaxID=1792290 RepID=A0A1A8TKD2_9GAMM|nr:alpha/beta hydrolase [Marinomonas spartinae]SBS34311.1 Tropinesterase [Marinomonas spartinae]SBS37554.1 Tropinesterase [Marinomonas spartinae]
MGSDVVFNLAHTKIAGLQTLSSNPSAVKVLCLHGWLDNAASFNRLTPYLSGLTHSSIDLAGHGLSDHRVAGSFYHLWDYALDVVSILNLSNQSTWLVGHSMGGAVAMIVAAIAPEKVRGLVVLDNMGPLTAKPSERVSMLQRSIQRMAKHREGRFARYETLDDMVGARMYGFTSLSREAASELVERGAILTDDDRWGWRHDHKLSFPSPYRMDEEGVAALISEIKCPALSLVAKEGVYANREGEAFVNARAAQFPWIKLKWLEGNHHFHLERDTAPMVAEEVRKFIDQN